MSVLPAFVGKLVQKTELLGVRHAYGDEVSPLWYGAVGKTFPAGGSDSDFRDPKRQPKSGCPASVCSGVWPAVLSLSEVLADAQLLWPEIQRQRLPAHERQRRPDLAEPGVLAGDIPDRPHLAS